MILTLNGLGPVSFSAFQTPEARNRALAMVDKHRKTKLSSVIAGSSSNMSSSDVLVQSRFRILLKEYECKQDILLASYPCSFKPPTGGFMSKTGALFVSSGHVSVVSENVIVKASSGTASTPLLADAASGMVIPFATVKYIRFNSAKGHCIEVVTLSSATLSLFFEDEDFASDVFSNIFNALPSLQRTVSNSISVTAQSTNLIAVVKKQLRVETPILHQYPCCFYDDFNRNRNSSHSSSNRRRDTPDCVIYGQLVVFETVVVFVPLLSILDEDGKIFSLSFSLDSIKSVSVKKIDTNNSNSNNNNNNNNNDPVSYTHLTLPTICSV